MDASGWVNEDGVDSASQDGHWAGGGQSPRNLGSTGLQPTRVTADGVIPFLDSGSGHDTVNPLHFNKTGSRKLNGLIIIMIKGVSDSVNEEGGRKAADGCP